MDGRGEQQLGAKGSGTQRVASEVDPSGDQLMGGSESRRNRAADSRCVARQLVMGSSDPHGLQLDDDRAPSCAKRPAFAIATHLPAEAQELAARPLPVLNKAEIQNGAAVTTAGPASLTTACE